MANLNSLSIMMNTYEETYAQFAEKFKRLNTLGAAIPQNDSEFEIVCAKTIEDILQGQLLPTFRKLNKKADVIEASTLDLTTLKTPPQPKLEPAGLTPTSCVTDVTHKALPQQQNPLPPTNGAAVEKLLDTQEKENHAPLDVSKALSSTAPTVDEAFTPQTTSLANRLLTPVSVSTATPTPHLLTADGRVIFLKNTRIIPFHEHIKILANKSPELPGSSKAVTEPQPAETPNSLGVAPRNVILLKNIRIIPFQPHNSMAKVVVAPFATQNPVKMSPSPSTPQLLIPAEDVNVLPPQLKLNVSPSITERPAPLKKRFQNKGLLYRNVNKIQQDQTFIDGDGSIKTVFIDNDGASAKSNKILRFGSAAHIKTVILGANGTVVSKEGLNKINWSAASSFCVKKLMELVFDREIMAGSSLTGMESAAHRNKNKPKKNPLDPAKVSDIIEFMMEQMPVRVQDIRDAIVGKCADETKRLRNRLKEAENPPTKRRKLNA